MSPNGVFVLPGLPPQYPPPDLPFYPEFRDQLQVEKTLEGLKKLINGLTARCHEGRQTQ